MNDGTIIVIGVIVLVYTILFILVLTQTGVGEDHIEDSEYKDYMDKLDGK